ncbi:MAG: aspartate ammonia-lyase [Arenicella sp.]
MKNRSMYGEQTALALINFPITDVRLNDFPEIIKALAMVKKSAALANAELGKISCSKAAAIIDVCEEIIDGSHHEHFVVDMIQGGAGTSTNMNANEVIANIALLKLGYKKNQYHFLHPNDDVNASQSTNDVYPTSLKLAILQSLPDLLSAQLKLVDAFTDRAETFEGVLKVGRTQLQDAVPITVSSEFLSFANTISEDIQRLKEVAKLLCEINLGGTAVGTGINAPTGYSSKAIAYLKEVSGYSLTLTNDLVGASSDLGAFVAFSGILKRISVKISKICNDLRLLSSGPRAGIGEIILPTVQAGSSIMPGKVNPVIPEVVNQVAYQVIGNDLTVTMAAESGQLQLNAMEPVLGYNILSSMRLLTNALEVLTTRCVNGIELDLVRCKKLLDESLVSVIALVPEIGYEKSAEIAKEALISNKTLHEIILEKGIISQQKLEVLFSSNNLLGNYSLSNSQNHCDSGKM